MDLLPFLFPLNEVFTHFVSRTFWVNVSNGGQIFSSEKWPTLLAYVCGKGERSEEISEKLSSKKFRGRC